MYLCQSPVLKERSDPYLTIIEINEILDTRFPRISNHTRSQFSIIVFRFDWWLIRRWWRGTSRRWIGGPRWIRGPKGRRWSGWGFGRTIGRYCWIISGRARTFGRCWGRRIYTVMLKKCGELSLIKAIHKCRVVARTL